MNCLDSIRPWGTPHLKLMAAITAIHWGRLLVQ
jgi:hypothetical protein